MREGNKREATDCMRHGRKAGMNNHYRTVNGVSYEDMSRQQETK